MASRKSLSVVRSAPRAERARVERYAARLRTLLRGDADSAAGALEQAMSDAKGVEAGKAMLELFGTERAPRAAAERAERLSAPAQCLAPLA